MKSKVFNILLLTGIICSFKTPQIPQGEVQESTVISEKKAPEQIDSTQLFKIKFLLKIIEIKNDEKRADFLKDNGYQPGIYRSDEPLVDGTTHTTIDTGFQKNDIFSKDYEFILFDEFMNYSTNEPGDRLVYKTRNRSFISNIKTEINSLELPVNNYGKFIHKNVIISFATDRYAYVDRKSYSIFSIILYD